MDISAEKSKTTVISTSNTSADITMNGQKLEKVTGFKNLGATLFMGPKCICDRSDDRTKKVLDKQLQQLSHQIQDLQVPCSLHSTLRLRDLDTSQGAGSLRLEHYNSFCWTTRTPPGDRQTKKASLVWTRLTVQDCAPGHDRRKLPSRPSEKIRIDNAKDWTSPPNNRPDWRRKSVSSSLISPKRPYRLNNDDEDDDITDRVNFWYQTKTVHMLI
ncbi:hypothetical protein DPMN_194534 [Dreissena polymorpha]|uniref:Uncharacterized protein n=1 Tax=Dreissena polymorpha TaxID=45954 RepID=A0A9D4B851_DREPO|nr:hypothetical protein DPMN_194534 [Dreissena polymorpha]